MKQKYKIIIFSIILAFITFIPVKTNALSITTQPLYAGQSIAVGQVETWNDSNNLYVKIIINNPEWKLKETHLYVGLLANMPQTKTGNPKVGLFPYNQVFDPAVTEYIYTIARNKINTDNFIIATHAVVEHFTNTIYMPEVNWLRGSEEQTLSFAGYGGNWLYNDVYNAFPVMDAVVWDNSLYDTVNPYINGVDYASWLYNHTNPNGLGYNGYSDLRLFKTNFIIPDNISINNVKLGVLNYPDRIPINDNVYVYVNGYLQFWGGTRANVINTHEGMVGHQAIGYNSGHQLETDGWYIPGTFPTLNHINQGNNILEVFTEENERWGGLGKLIITVEGKTVDQSETAWAFGNRMIQQGNWATYFNYSWQ